MSKVQKLMDSLAECGSKMDALAARVDGAVARKDAAGDKNYRDHIRKLQQNLRDTEDEIKMASGSEKAKLVQHAEVLREEIEDEKAQEKSASQYRSGKA